MSASGRQLHLGVEDLIAGFPIDIGDVVVLVDEGALFGQ